MLQTCMLLVLVLLTTDEIGSPTNMTHVSETPASNNVVLLLMQTIGNHEWDKGLSSLKQYLDAKTNKDVLGANIEFNGHELKDKVKPYVVKTVKGKKVRLRWEQPPGSLAWKGPWQLAWAYW
jgi:hypothetical protein